MKRENNCKNRAEERRELSHNGLGYSDPTAYKAIVGSKNDRRSDEYIRFHKFLEAVYSLCNATGFHLDKRICVTDLQSGRKWS